jgi:2-polyprenyl-3-methyl-5-hydroxy-6-metoxy-1,4-benzoquinol methylase
MRNTFRERSQELEWMDLGPEHYTPDEYRTCLHHLDRIGRWLGGDRATFQALAQLKQVPRSIIDVGCGGGLFTLKMGARYPHTKVVGRDLSAEAIAFADEQHQKRYPGLSNVSFEIASKPELEEHVHYDVVMATLMCHHLTDAELVAFLQQARGVAQQAIILNDLHRHPLASMSFGAIAPWLFPNRLIWHDGLLSIRRAFTRGDWIRLLREAGIPESSYCVRWHWAFRWIVVISQS